MAGEWPALVVTSGPESGKVFVVGQASLLLGRAPDADVRLSSHTVSQQHARVHQVDGAVVVEDLRSHNGTHVNGTPISHRTPLQPGDSLQLGDTELVFDIVGRSRDKATGGGSGSAYSFGDVGGPVVAGRGNRYTGRDSYQAGGDIYHGDHVDVTADYDPWDEMFQGTGPGRAMMAVGGVVALLGFGLWMYIILSGFGGPPTPGESPFDMRIFDLPAPILAFGMFLGGGIIAGIGSGMSKAARKRARGRTR